MAASYSRTAIWFIGLLLVLAAVWVAWEALNLDRWIPTGVLLAVMLVILGLAVMAMSDRFGWGRRVERVESSRVGPTYGTVAPPATGETATTTRVVEDDDRPLRY